MKTLRTACLILAFAAACVWGIHRLQSGGETVSAPPSAIRVDAAVAAKVESDLADQRMKALKVPDLTPAALQELIRDVYGVESSRFIQPDLLWVTLPPGANVQATCQAIANIWAARSGKPWVRVESWRNNQRLAQATVSDGRPVTP